MQIGESKFKPNLEAQELAQEIANFMESKNLTKSDFSINFPPTTGNNKFSCVVYFHKKEALNLDGMEAFLISKKVNIDGTNGIVEVEESENPIE